MAEDTKKSDGNAASPVRAEETAAVASGTGRAASRPPGIAAIVERPVYGSPGRPPIPPGEAVTLCPTTAREWLVAGIIRLAPGASLPVEPRTPSGEFPVWSASVSPLPGSHE